MARTRKKAVYVDVESTFGTDPSSDGSGYLHIPALAIGELTDGKEVLETNYFTGRNFPTAPVMGRDGGEFTMEVPLIGLSSAAGDGVDASSVTDDWLDVLLTHMFGTQDTTSGEGLASSSGSTLTLDTDSHDLNDIVALHESGIPTTGERSHFAVLTVDNTDGTYTMAPTPVENYTTAAVAYGVKQYRPDDDGGASLAFVYVQDDVTYTLTGCRVSSASIQGDVGQMIRLSLTVMFDAKTVDTGKSSLPSVSAAPANTPVLTLLSPVWFNGSSFCTPSFSIDLGITASAEDCTEKTNGRADIENTAIEPSGSFSPLFATSTLNLKRNGTQGRLLIQMGGGAVSGGVLNALCFEATEAVLVEANPTDENGRIRHSVTFRVYDSGSGPVCQLARA